MSTPVSNLPPPNIHNDPGIADINTNGPQQISPTGIASEKYTEGPHKTLTETSSIQSRNVSTQNPKHPHLGELFSEEINEINHPKTQVVDAGIIDRLLKEGIIDKDGNIEFSGFGNFIERNKANLSGSIYLEGDKLQVNIEGNCGPEAAKILQALKEKVNGDNDGPITLDPQLIGITKTDEDILARGGQMQYKPLSHGKILKMTLDPGVDGQGGGLTLSVWGKVDGKIKQLKEITIPLSVVFEGQSYNDFSALKNGEPLLKNWREQKLFQDSVIRIELEKLFLVLKQTLSDNTNDVNRTEAQNTLWHAVYEYLRITGEQPNTLQPQPSAPPPPNEVQEIIHEKTPEQPQKLTETPTEVLKPETPKAAAATSIPIEERITQHTPEEKPLRPLTSPKVKVTKGINTSEQNPSLLEAAEGLSNAISGLRDILDPNQDPNQNPKPVSEPATVEGFATKPPQAAMAEVVEIPQVQMVETPQPTPVEPNTLGLGPQQAIEEETAATPQTDKNAHPVITSAIHDGAKTDNQNLVDAANDVLKALQGLLESLHENNVPVQEALKQVQYAVLDLKSQIPGTEKLQQATLLADNLTALVQTLKGNSNAESKLQSLLDAAQILSEAISKLATQPSVSAQGQAATSISETKESLKVIKVTTKHREVKKVSAEKKVKRNPSKAKEELKKVNKAFKEARETLKADPTAATDTKPNPIATETHGTIPVSKTKAATSVQVRAARKSISEGRKKSHETRTRLVKAAENVSAELQGLERVTRETLNNPIDSH